jgi:uncharacterized DUF497 family protein
MEIEISGAVREKLAIKHNVTEKEIEQCFMNRAGLCIYDTREEHATDPKTRWFIAETNARRLLKVSFIPYPGRVVIKTAYEPNQVEIDLYEEIGR